MYTLELGKTFPLKVKCIPVRDVKFQFSLEPSSIEVGLFVFWWINRDLEELTSVVEIQFELPKYWKRTLVQQQDACTG